MKASWRPSELGNARTAAKDVWPEGLQTPLDLAVQQAEFVYISHMLVRQLEKLVQTCAGKLVAEAQQS